MDIRPISIATMRERAGALLRAHYDEIARHKRVMVLDPDWERYEQLEAAGSVKCLGAFVDDELIGYSVSYVIPAHPHYRGLRAWQNDVLFVAHAHRAGGAGVRLIRSTEAAALADGGALLLWHAKPGTRLESLLPRLGYSVQDVIFSKEL